MGRFFAVASVCALALMSFASSSAVAANPACGATLTQSVMLTANLDCSGYTNGPALIIGAPNVTVDLGGYTLTGPGGDAIQFEGRSLPSMGVLNGKLATNKGGFSAATVKNGTVANFAYGVIELGAKSPTVQNAAFTPPSSGPFASQDYAIVFVNTSGATARGNIVTGFTTGILSEFGKATNTIGNTITIGSGSSTLGVGYLGEKGSRMTTNTVTAGNSANSKPFYDAVGSGDTLVGNSAGGSDVGTGFTIINPKNAFLAGNIAQHLGAGFSLLLSGGKAKGSAALFGNYAINNSGQAFASAFPTKGYGNVSESNGDDTCTLVDCT
jgi:hypothetical protein